VIRSPPMWIWAYRHALGLAALRVVWLGNLRRRQLTERHCSPW
jgi:hypothetical protein